jgi:hypothetical protein
VTSGGSFGSNSFVQHIGIGKAKAIESLTIEWPTSRTRQVFKNVPLNVRIEIQEFEKEFRRVELKRFALAGPSSDEHEHEH